MHLCASHGGPCRSAGSTFFTFESPGPGTGLARDVGMGNSCMNESVLVWTSFLPGGHPRLGDRTLSRCLVKAGLGAPEGIHENIRREWRSRRQREVRHVRSLS